MSEELAPADQVSPPRRALLLGAGAAGVAVLAGCGTDTADNGGLDTQDSTAPSSPTGQRTGDDGVDASESASGDAGGAAKLAAAADVPVGGGVIVVSRGVVVTQPAKGTFKGFSAICTHTGCPLSAVDGGTINCSCHGSRFSIEDGSVKKGPANKALAETAVTKVGDDIVLA